MMELESMAIEMPKVEGHPNRAGFRGVLTVVDVASQRAPSGSRGHRVVLTRAAAEAALPSLLGMALDYAPSFDRHDQRRKVGVITSAEITRRNLEVGGYLFAKDFPDIVEEIANSARRSAAKGRDLATQESGMVPADKNASIAARRRGSFHSRARLGIQAAVTCPRIESEGARLRAKLAAAVATIRGLTSRRASVKGGAVEVRAEAAGQLGMSYEVADVKLADARARVWILTRVTFTGAAILRRDKAAYEGTWIELCS